VVFTLVFVHKKKINSIVMENSNYFLFGFGTGIAVASICFSLKKYKNKILVSNKK